MNKRKAEDVGEDDATAAFEDAANKARLEPNEVVAGGDNAASERRSSRLLAKKLVQSHTTPVQQLQFDSDSDSDVAAVKGKGRKKRRKSASKKSAARRRKNSKVGRLEVLMYIPIDIFCEIAASLSPQDLLNMARSSKTLRGLLTSKDSKAIWRAAREGVELPECPSDLSEMQYADLLFCKGCYFCDAPRAQELFYPFRLRLCGRCRDKNFASLFYVKKILETDEEFFFLLPNDVLCYHLIVYYVDEAKAVWKELHSLTADSDEQAKFLAERKQKVADIKDNAAKVREWTDLQRKKKAAEQKEIMKERERNVAEKLKLVGYTNKDLDSTLDTSDLRSRWDKLLKDPKPLTDRIWKNIKPKVEKVILERRERRSVLEDLASLYSHDTDCECYDCAEGYGSENSCCDCSDCVAYAGYFGYGGSDDDLCDSDDIFVADFGP